MALRPIALLLVLGTATAAARADVGDDIAAFQDQDMLAGKARRYLAKLVADGELDRAAEVLAYMQQRPDAARTPLLDLRERILFGGLRGDFAFLPEFGARYGEPRERERLGLAYGEDRLWEALAGRLPEAQAKATAAPLGAQDRAFADLALRWAAEAPGLEEEGETFLRAHPGSSYQDFIIDHLVHRWQRGQSALELTGFGAGLRLDRATAGTFGVHPGGGFALGGTLARVYLGFRLLGANTTLHRTFTRDGAVWSAGESPNWVSVEGTLGARTLWGHHAVLVAGGLGVQQFVHHPGKDDKQLIAFFTGSLHAAYDFIWWLPARSDAVTQGGVFLRAEVTRLQAFQTRAADHTLSPSGWLFQLGLGMESRHRMRIVSDRYRPMGVVQIE